MLNERFCSARQETHVISHGEVPTCPLVFLVTSFPWVDSSLIWSPWAELPEMVHWGPDREESHLSAGDPGNWKPAMVLTEWLDILYCLDPEVSGEIMSEPNGEPARLHEQGRERGLALGRLWCSRTLVVCIPCEPLSTFLDCSNFTNLKSRVSAGMPDSDSCCPCLDGLIPHVPAPLSVCVLGVPSWLLIHYQQRYSVSTKYDAMHFAWVL